MPKSRTQIARRMALSGYGHIEDAIGRVAALYGKAGGESSEFSDLFIDALGALEVARQRMAQFIVGLGIGHGEDGDEEDGEEN